MDISSEDAKRLDAIEKRLIKEFKEQIRFEDEENRIIQKLNEPVTSAINKVEGKIGEVLYENKNLMNLVPVVQNFADLSIHDSDESYSSPMKELPSSTPYRRNIIEDSTMIDPSTLVSPETLNQIIGPLATKYLPKLKDNVFGLYYNEHKKSHMIGNKRVFIDKDDLAINGKKYVGTHGLWRLLSYKDAPDQRLYDDDDLNNYKKILWETESIYKNNDKSTNKPKSSKGDKYVHLIKQICIFSHS